MIYGVEGSCVCSGRTFLSAAPTNVILSEADRSLRERYINGAIPNARVFLQRAEGSGAGWVEVAVRLPSLFEKLFCNQDGGHRIRPTGVERKVRNSLDQLLLSNSVLYGSPEMESQLVRAVQGNQRRDRDKAAVTFR